MEIRYKVFEKLKKEDITITQMQSDLRLSGSIVQKFRTNGSTTLETIGRVCEYLQCPIEDVVEILYTNASEQQKKELEAEKAEYQKKINEIQKKIDCLN